jgi:hypothetical protein
MRFAYWITKATDTRLEYVMPIAFPRKKRLGLCVHTFPVLYIIRVKFSLQKLIFVS